MRARYLAAVISSVLSVTAAQAAPNIPPLPGERDLIRDRQERLLEEQRQRLEELKQLPGAKPLSSLLSRLQTRAVSRSKPSACKVSACSRQRSSKRCSSLSSIAALAVANSMSYSRPSPSAISTEAMSHRVPTCRSRT